MIVFSHLLLSRIIRAQIKKSGCSLNARRFAYGNVKPDISPMIRNQKHNISESYDFLRQAITALAQSPYEGHRAAYSFRLGIICHYVTDFFTFAHNECFDGSFKQHMSYEMQIHEKVSRFKGSLRSNALLLHRADQPQNLDELLDYLDRMHVLYMENTYASPSRDCLFALVVCSTLCISLVAISSGIHRYAPVVGF